MGRCYTKRVYNRKAKAWVVIRCCPGRKPPCRIVKVVKKRH